MNRGTEATVLERQQWQQSKQQSYFGDPHFNAMQFDGSFMKTDRGGVVDINSSLSTTFSGCPFKVDLAEKMGRTSLIFPSSQSKETLKKRKAEKVINKDGAENVTDKRIKGEVEETSTSADASKASQVQKTDYIHVRARRGQATDSHSLAERVRREKISERMRYLQDLVPGCNKIIGKAGMLDEIINYVQSLQRQVEFLSMKLASVNPTIDDVSNDNLFPKQMFQSCAGDSYPAIGMSPEVINPPYFPFSQMAQVVSTSALNMEFNNTEMSLEKPAATMSMPEEFFNSSYFSQVQSPVWENDLQSIYNIAFHHQGRSTALLSQHLTGNLAGSDLKMEI